MKRHERKVFVISIPSSLFVVVLELRLKKIIGQNKLQGIWKCTLTVCKHVGLSLVEGVLRTNLCRHNTSTKLGKMFEEIFIIIDNKFLWSRIVCMLSYEPCTIKILIFSPWQKKNIWTFLYTICQVPRKRLQQIHMFLTCRKSEHNKNIKNAWANQSHPNYVFHDNHWSVF